MGDEAKTTRLVLVRHGEAKAALDRIVGGPRGCTGLSELGRQQAERLQDRLTTSGFHTDAIVASTLPRAVETGEILARGLGRDLAGVEQREELCEVHPGEADGLPWDVVEQRYGPDTFGEERERPLSPGGETFMQFGQRVALAVDRLVEDYRGQTVLVACHGGVVVAATLTLLGLPFRWFSETVVNTSLTEWVHRDDQWFLARFNDAAHLE